MKHLLLLTLLALSFPITVAAAEPLVWSVNSREDVLRGSARGVSIDAAGGLSPAPRLNDVYRTEQPFIWSSAVDAAGNVYLGTGSEGRVYRVDANGRGSLFADLGELNVSALAVGQRGDIFAATSPDGKVYRLDATGSASVYFDPKEKYIWSLAFWQDGSLAVGTGEGGKIFRVRQAGAAPEASLLFDSGETHIITLAADRAGNLFAGTDPGGIVIRIGPDGKAFALLDSPLREIHELSIGPDGSVYALALAESVSTKTEPAATPEFKTVTVERPTATPGEQPKSRYDLKEAKSAVYRIHADGGNDLLWASAGISAFSVLARNDGGVLVGTSDRGRIYSIAVNGDETLVAQSDEGQISTIRANGKGFIATSSNQGRLFAFGSVSGPEGTYESAVLDARGNASWGRIWWRSGGAVSIQTRSGNTERPDDTWSPWSAAYQDGRNSQVASPKARYLQWRAVFGAGGTLGEVNVAFQPRNIAPEVTAIQIIPANVGLAPNPPVPVDPNIELSGMDPALFGLQIVPIPPRRVFQRGARAFQWTAEDRNGDRLVYDVFYREVSEGTFRLLRENQTENFVSIDSQTLADGRYVIKVVARDSPSNTASQTLSGERISEPFDVDNGAPTVTGNAPVVAGDKARVAFEASDAASYVARAEYSVNGGEWLAVYADDGIADGPRERFTVEIALGSPGDHAVTLRVFDANGNSGSARVVVRK